MELVDRKKVNFLLFSYFLFFLFGAIFKLASNPAGYTPSIYDLGQILGVWGLTAMVFQISMVSRTKALERNVGLDNIMGWHKFNGIFLFLLILFHPVLIFSKDFLSGISIISIVGSFTWYYWLGESAFLLLVFSLSVTFISKWFDYDYEKWKIAHRSGYIVFILAFIHSFFSGTDISPGTPLYYWWYILLGVGLAAIARRLWVVYIKPYNFQIVSINKETHNSRTISLKPIAGSLFDFRPGQFAFVRFYSKNLSSEEHHFTLSGPPGKGTISFTIKESGDYTGKLGALKVNDFAKVDGPYGVFDHSRIDGEYLFIAAGIGITPLMSMLKGMIKNKSENENKDNKKKQDKNEKDLILIYANKTPKDVVFKKELEKMKKTKKIKKLVFIFSKEKGKEKGSYKGHVNKKILKKEVKDIKKRKVFLVGPAGFMKSVKKDLRALGVPDEHVFSEKFMLR